MTNRSPVSALSLRPKVSLWVTPPLRRSSGCRMITLLLWSQGSVSNKNVAGSLGLPISSSTAHLMLACSSGSSGMVTDSPGTTAGISGIVASHFPSSCWTCYSCPECPLRALSLSRVSSPRLPWKGQPSKVTIPWSGLGFIRRKNPTIFICTTLTLLSPSYRADFRCIMIRTFKLLCGSEAWMHIFRICHYFSHS